MVCIISVYLLLLHVTFLYCTHCASTINVINYRFTFLRSFGEQLKRNRLDIKGNYYYMLCRLIRCRSTPFHLPLSLILLAVVVLLPYINVINFKTNGVGRSSLLRCLRKLSISFRWRSQSISSSRSNNFKSKERTRADFSLHIFTYSLYKKEFLWKLKFASCLFRGKIYFNVITFSIMGFINEKYELTIY